MTIWQDLAGIWNRLTTEPRYPGASRVPMVMKTLSGVHITPDTAVTVPVVWACLRYLSQTVAVLPWHVMRETDTGGEIVRTHHIDWLLHKRPSKEWSSFQFRETMTHWALRWGNAYAEIERDGAGRPFALWPIHPERVEVCRDPETKVLFYEVDHKLEFRAEDIFHIRGFGEGPVGVNVITYAAQSIGWAAAAQLFGATFFGNGMNVAGVVKVKKQLSIEAFQRLKKELASLYGGVRNSNKTAVLDGDMEWSQVSVDPNKAQFIATNQYLVEDICRWFGVPPHKVMHLLRATFSNIEHQAIEVVVDSISPWVKRWEDEADYKLFGNNRQNFYTKMNMKALMRGDVVSRGNFYQLMRYVGAYSANDILRKEDENTIGPEGDKRVMQSQFTTLERIGEDPPTQSNEDPFVRIPERAPTPQLPAPEEDEDADDDDDDAQARTEMEFLVMITEEVDG
jgi:HK97 family phage portal protein